MWKRLEQTENGKTMIVGAGIGSKMRWVTKAYFLFGEWRSAASGEPLPMQPTHYKEV